MSKLIRFIIGMTWLAGAVLDHCFGLNFVAIPLAIGAILILGRILKKEMGL